MQMENHEVALLYQLHKCKPHTLLVSDKVCKGGMNYARVKSGDLGHKVNSDSDLV